MFTGIVEEVGRVAAISAGKLAITACRVLQGMELGGSISVNGACLTVTEFDDNSLSVDIMPETLDRTNIGLLHVGDQVNLERPLTMEKFVGGHLVQGHVDGTGKVASITKKDTTTLIRVEASPEIMQYIVEKGFISVDGISLTIVNVEADSFTVSIVDYTLKNTVLSNRKSGDVVNIEVDIIAKYVERINKTRNSGISIEFLREHGFMSS
ncbi:MAG: riboflavin synthase [Dehalococcoidia bacterium]|nr:MAG: riboflavin synthase [Dehalococcoidia bacterium]